MKRKKKRLRNKAGENLQMAEAYSCRRKVWGRKSAFLCPFSPGILLEQQISVLRVKHIGDGEDKKSLGVYIA